MANRRIKEKKNNLVVDPDIINAETEYQAAQKRRDQQKEKQRVIDELWQEICVKVEELNKARRENLIDTWVSIRDKKMVESANVELSEVDKQIIGMIEDKISELMSVRDENYFREVEYVTGFSYLMEDTLIAKARLGHSSRKFRSKDNYTRYCALRNKMREVGDEEIAIEKLLSDPNTDEVTKRILEARKKEMERREVLSGDGR